MRTVDPLGRGTGVVSPDAEAVTEEAAMEEPLGCRLMDPTEDPMDTIEEVPLLEYLSSLQISEWVLK